MTTSNPFIPTHPGPPTRDESLAMMHREADWPAWPFLPLKHRDKPDPVFPGMRLTAMLATGQGATVFIGNIFFGINDQTPREEYNTFEEVLDAGWIVD